MNTSKLTWKVVRVHADLLEKTLSDLSEAEFEVFSVQVLPQGAGEQWAIVARTEAKDEMKTAPIGFRARNG
jgi:hypothetical protein